MHVARLSSPPLFPHHTLSDVDLWWGQCSAPRAHRCMHDICSQYAQCVNVIWLTRNTLYVVWCGYYERGARCCGFVFVRTTLYTRLLFCLCMFQGSWLFVQLAGYLFNYNIFVYYARSFLCMCARVCLMRSLLKRTYRICIRTNSHILLYTYTAADNLMGH